MPNKSPSNKALAARVAPQLKQGQPVNSWKTQTVGGTNLYIAKIPNIITIQTTWIDNGCLSF